MSQMRLRSNQVLLFFILFGEAMLDVTVLFSSFVVAVGQCHIFIICRSLVFFVMELGKWN